MPSDAELRLQWLKARVPAKAVPTPKPAPKIGFRSGLRGVAPREIQAAETKPTPARLAESTSEPAPAAETKTPAKPSKSTAAAEKTTAAPATKATALAAASPTPAPAAEKKVTAAKSTPAGKLATGSAASPSPSPKKSLAASNPSPTPKVAAAASPAPAAATPKTIARTSPTPAAKQIAGATPASGDPASRTARTAKSTPSPKVAAATPTATPAAKITAAATPAKTRTVETSPAPAPKLALSPAVESIPAGTTRQQITFRGNTATTTTNTPTTSSGHSNANAVGGRYPWKTNIVTTVFWVGERPTANNPTPNHASSWDLHWAQNFGGFDNPDPSARRNFIPVRFTPKLNPFYVALPYNDVTRGTTKPEARRVIPWFREAFRREGQSVCRDRWIAIRSKSGRVCYAQWSDCGPFRTDHWQYVFGNDRPMPNLNRGAGLDVSPAVRDFLGLDGTDLTDWKFVDFKDVPQGPWSRHGENNTFVQRGNRAPREIVRNGTRTADNIPHSRAREL